MSAILIDSGCALIMILVALLVQKDTSVGITPIWVSLAVGILGGLGSAMFTQYLAGRREAAARSYEHRRAAYVDFITGFHQQWRVLVEIKGQGYPQGDPPDDYLQPSYDRLIQIEIFGSMKTANLAEKTLHALNMGGTEPVEDMLERLLRQVRRDLSIPGRRGTREKPVYPEFVKGPPVPPPSFKPPSQ